MIVIQATRSVNATSLYTEYRHLQSYDRTIKFACPICQHINSGFESMMFGMTGSYSARCQSDDCRHFLPSIKKLDDSKNMRLKYHLEITSISVG